MHTLFSPCRIAFSALTLATFSLATQAQTQNDAFDNDVSQQANSQAVERILVTANRSPSRLLTTAASIGSVDKSELDLINHQHINQALHRISGTWISRGNGQEHLTAIRSPVLTGAGGCGAFFMALDGISLRAPGFCNANQLFDANTEQAQRIEVLRGPSSTLFGSNAVHGVINIISPDAYASAANSVGLRAGRDDHLRASLAYRTQEDNSAFAVFGNLTQNNGYQQNSGYDQQKMTLVYQQTGDVWQNKTVLDIANLEQETAGFVQGFEVFKDEQIRRSNPNPEAFRDATSLRAYSQFSMETANGNFSVTPYIRRNQMAFLQHFLPWKALEENSHSSAGIQSQYRYQKDNLNLTTGFDFDFTRANLRETQDQAFSPNIPQGEHYDYNVNASTTAAYVQAQWELSNWQLTLGGRLENVLYDYDNLLKDGNACAPEVATCRFTRPEDQNVSFTVFSPSFSALYIVNQYQTAYFKLSQGFRAPQATELFRLQNNQSVADLNEEEIDAIELGWRLVSDKYAFNASVFWQEKKDFIFQDTNRQNISNGETRHRGLELSGKYHLSPSVYISGNATYATHEYANAIAISNTNIEGNEIDTAPRTIGSAQLGWHVSDTIQTELSLQHVGDYFLNPENTAEYDGHTLVDLNLHYEYSPQLRFNANIYNLLDKDYAERADFGFGNYRYFVGQPRRIFVGATWSWSQQ